MSFIPFIVGHHDMDSAPICMCCIIASSGATQTVRLEADLSEMRSALVVIARQPWGK
jgi:hypothetical protein